MPDRSFCPCAVCGHAQKVHVKNYARCYDCVARTIFADESMHYYKRLENLEYLEWCYSQKGDKK